VLSARVERMLIAINPTHPEPRKIRRAVDALEAGEVIAYPTDTVYGIACALVKPWAVGALLNAKGRGRHMPPPVLVGSRQTLDGLVFSLPTEARELVAAFWPGPLTMVLPRAESSEGWDLGGDPATVGIRMPRHTLALAILAETGPLAVTSANRSGEPPATTCDELFDLFGDDVAVYLCEDDPLEGAASTVVDLAHGPARVLRAGSVDASQLATILPDEPSLLDSPPSS